MSSDWSARSGNRRLWDGDESLWTSSGEARWLGWLDVIDRQLANIAELREIARRVRGRYRHAVLLGMGGSSLCPEVLRFCFGVQEGFPELKVLDSTDPGQIEACSDAIDLQESLFISASKSGSTIETALLTQHFLDCLAIKVGARKAARQFVAITDCGSQLDRKASDDGFGAVHYGEASIGGRYSALSSFGTVPASAMGLDVERLLLGARAMQRACGPTVPLESNPGVRLGLMLGVAALAGRDKLTLLPSPGVAPLGAWIEQLIAESTGKRGRGIVPVDGEERTDPSRYGDDRVFVGLAVASERDTESEGFLAELARRGHPVARIGIAALEELGQEFFRWEMATAVAGAVLGINPFDQPDVESAKVEARDLAATYEANRSLPTDEPLLEQAGIQLFASPSHAERLRTASPGRSLGAVIRSHVELAGPGDYVAIQAFLRSDEGTRSSLARMRRSIQSRSRSATCVGFGPRFLHSTGQLHKGGPDNGVFLQIGCAYDRDIPVPGRDLTFGVVKTAQALGDFRVLSRLGRRALRVHVRGDCRRGLSVLEKALAASSQ